MESDMVQSGLIYKEQRNKRSWVFSTAGGLFCGRPTPNSKFTPLWAATDSPLITRVSLTVNMSLLSYITLLISLLSVQHFSFLSISAPYFNGTMAGDSSPWIWTEMKRNVAWARWCISCVVCICPTFTALNIILFPICYHFPVAHSPLSCCIMSHQLRDANTLRWVHRVSCLLYIRAPMLAIIAPLLPFFGLFHIRYISCFNNVETLNTVI